MRRAAVVTVTLAVAAGAAAAALVTARDGGAGDGSISAVPAAPREAVEVLTSVTPATHLFGDRVHARMDVVLDTRRIDPGEVEPQVRFEPFELVAPVTVSRAAANGVALVRYDYELACLVPACVDAEDGTTVRLPQIILEWAASDGSFAVNRRVDWPEVAIGSRIREGDVLGPQAGADADVLSVATYRVQPDVLGWLASALAALLAVAVVGAVASRVARRRAASPAGAGAPPEQGPAERLEHALERAAAAAAGGDAARRRAVLDALARRLATAGLAELAARTSRLAWSREEPTAEAIDALAAGARRAAARSDGP